MLGPVLDLPTAQNRYQDDFIARVAGCFRHATGDDLPLDPANRGSSAWHGDFALLTHRGGPDAVLNYGNLFAQRLWACGWDAFTRLPSSATAPHEGREARAAMMAQVMQDGFVRGYDGMRIASDGRRFIIRDVTIWRLRDAGGDFGVAAFFHRADPIA